MNAKLTALRNAGSDRYTGIEPTTEAEAAAEVYAYMTTICGDLDQNAMPGTRLRDALIDTAGDHFCTDPNPLIRAIALSDGALSLVAGQLAGEQETTDPYAGVRDMLVSKGWDMN